MMKVALLYLPLIMGLVFASDQSAIWELEDYNGWNLPFMKTVEMSVTDKRQDFPQGFYQLEVDPSAYFSVVFTDLDIKQVENPVTLNYTFYGSENY